MNYDKIFKSKMNTSTVRVVIQPIQMNYTVLSLSNNSIQ